MSCVVDSIFMKIIDFCVPVPPRQTDNRQATNIAMKPWSWESLPSCVDLPVQVHVPVYVVEVLKYRRPSTVPLEYRAYRRAKGRHNCRNYAS